MSLKLYKKNPNSRVGLVTWLVCEAEIAEELAKGWSKREVYSRFSDRLQISYPQFVRYCRRAPANLAKPRPSAPEQKAPRPTTPKPAAAKPETRSASSESSSLPTFHYDPMDAYREKFD